jgi:hypothetical protein
MSILCTEWENDSKRFSCLIRNFSYLITLVMLKFLKNFPRDLHHILLFIVMEEVVVEHFSCMPFDRSGYIMLWTRVRVHICAHTHAHTYTHTQTCTHTHTHTYVYIDIRKSKLARRIQHRKRSGWDFMNSFIYNRIYTFRSTQTRTDYTVSGIYCLWLL